MVNTTQAGSQSGKALHESLSALMDGEASELELHRILASIEDESLRRAWRGMHQQRDSLHGAVTYGDVDLSLRVRDALADTPVLSTPELERDASAPGGWRRSLTSFAVAASVTAVAVIGSQQWLASDEGAAGSGPVTTASSPVAVGGAAPVPASFGPRSDSGAGRAAPAPAPALGPGYQELARQRLHMYSDAHAEQAARNTPQGFVPLVRMPEGVETRER
jgi:sigma-E factor negative regulatory protein RseA